MKVLVLLLGGLILTVLTACLGTAFMWLGWNYGVVPALTFAKPVGLLTAFCLSLFLSGMGAMFKSTLTVNSKE
jgi:hypothetical protein